MQQGIVRDGRSGTRTLLRRTAVSHVLGGHVCKAPVREYGKIEVTVDKTSKLFGNVSEKTICWMSHNDYIEKEAPGFRIVAHTPDCPVAAAECAEKKL